MTRRRNTLIFVEPPPVPVLPAGSFALPHFPRPASLLLPPAFAAVVPAFQHVRVRGDGRCLFRAIAKSLARLDGGRALPEHLERADADYLRKLAWTAICKKRRSEFVSKHIIEGSITSYCAVSNQPIFYAGEPELFALADELKVPIAVYLQNGRSGFTNIATYGQQHAKKAGAGKIVNLLYVNGNHYDALFSK